MEKLKKDADAENISKTNKKETPYKIIVNTWKCIVIKKMESLSYIVYTNILYLSSTL